MNNSIVCYFYKALMSNACMDVETGCGLPLTCQKARLLQYAN